MNPSDLELLPATAAFDRELGLDELLGAVDPVLIRRLQEALLPDGALVAGDGRELAGQSPADGERTAVRYELAPLAWLMAPAEARPRAHALAEALEHLLRMAARYLMASDLHLRAVREDYLALQEKHAALQQSEARYRELAGELERRVQDQVRTIEERQRQLFHAERLASVGRLAAGMAHEINNPIGFITSNLRMAVKYLGELRTDRGDEHRELFEDFAALLAECTDGAARIAAIVRDMKAFSNVDGAAVACIDPEALLQNVRAMATPLIGAKVRCEIVAAPLPPVRARPAELSQALLNLVLNAAQAMPEGGVVRLAADAAVDGIAVTVADSGCGIAPELLDRVFDPFFTTRGVGQGSGLGLTVARDVARAHDGHIVIDSAPGSGTTVTIHLPAAVIMAGGENRDDNGAHR